MSKYAWILLFVIVLYVFHTLFFFHPTVHHYHAPSLEDTQQSHHWMQIQEDKSPSPNVVNKDDGSSTTINTNTNTNQLQLRQQQQQQSKIQEREELGINQSSKPTKDIQPPPPPPPQQQQQNEVEVVVESPQRPSSSQPRITYTLHPNGTFHDTFLQSTFCVVARDRKQFPPILQNPSSTFDFTTTISTNLNLLFMGDSVAIQFAQGMDEALGVVASLDGMEQIPPIQEERHVLKYEWGKHEAVTLSKSKGGKEGGGVGGGLLGSFRINGFLSRKRQGGWFPNVGPKKGLGAWNPEDVDALYNSSLWDDNVHDDDKDNGVKDENGDHGTKTFDAMVFRIQHGWLKLKDITLERVEEVVQVAHDLFHVSTIIFPTIPFSNNIATMQDFEDMQRINEMIRTFAHSYQPPGSGGGVQQILVMEFGNLIQLLLEQNAMALEYDLHNDTHPYWLERIEWPEKNQIHAPIPLLCSERKTHMSRNCKRNMFSIDGMHYCMGSIGNRIFAVTACLLACVYNEEEHGDGQDDLRTCEAKCNQQYMSVEPIRDTMWNTKLK